MSNCQNSKESSLVSKYLLQDVEDPEKARMQVMNANDLNHWCPDQETSFKFQQLLQAAGIEGLVMRDGRSITDPGVLQELSREVGIAVDEAAEAMGRGRLESSEEASVSLTQVCLEGNVEAVGVLLENGFDPNEITPDGDSPLLVAVANNKKGIVDLLLNHKADPNLASKKKDCTPLMEAASGGHESMVRLLLEKGAQVEMRSPAGNTALHCAAASGHVHCLSVVLESVPLGDEMLEVQNDNGHTPLMEASSNGCVEAARLLLQHRAGVNTHSTEFKESPLTLASYKGHMEMVQFLLENGADPEHRTDEMHTALMEASMDGHVEVARVLIAHGAQVTMPADSFESPLTLAACGGHTELAALLIGAGADVEEVNDEGYTPLMEAAREGHCEMVSLLLAHSAEVNVQTDETQETALTLACCGGFMEVAELLLRCGADLEQGCSTPLMEAAQEGHLDLVQRLIQKGAKINAETATGDTALHYACENGHVEVCRELLDHDARLEHACEGGRTPLMKASRAGNIECVQLLVERGAPVNTLSAHNEHTALSLACSGGHYRVVEYLLQHGADPKSRLKDGSTLVIEAARSGNTAVMRLLLDYPHCMDDADWSPVGYPTPCPGVGCQDDSGIGAHPEFSLGMLQDFLANSGSQRPEDLLRQLYQQSGASLPEPGPLAVDSGTPQEDSHQRFDDIIAHCLRYGKEMPPEAKLKVTEELRQLEADFARETSLLNSGQPSRMSRSTLESGRNIADRLAAIVDRTLTVDGASSEDSQQTSANKPTAATRRLRTHQPPNAALPNGTAMATPPSPPPVPSQSPVRSSSDVTSRRRFLPFQAGAGGEQTSCPEDHPSGCSCSQHHMICPHDQTRTAPDGLCSSCGGLGGSCPCTSSITDGEQRTVRHTDTNHCAPCSVHPHHTCKSGTASSGTQQRHRRGQQPLPDLPPHHHLQPDGPCLQPPHIPEMDVNACTESSMESPLTLACMGGHADLVRLLLDRGGNLEHRDKKSYTPLHSAVMAGHLAVVKVLLDRNADIEAQVDRSKDTALSLACSNNKIDSPVMVEIVHELLMRGANREHRNVSDYTPMSLAASGGHVDLIRVLLEAGAEINSRTGSKLGISPLMLAAMNGHVDAVKLLLDEGSDINAQIETNRNTALTLACFQGRNEVVRLLVERRANLEHRAKTGLTPLMEAASGGFLEVGRTLVEHGADVNAAPVPASRDTSLTIAADKGHAKFVHLLLESKAHVDVRNKKGATPLWLACSGGHLEVVQHLCDKADVNASDNRKISCLMSAFRKGHVKLVKFLARKVTQFPADNDCIRFIQSISHDTELSKRCRQCMDTMVAAKDKQTAEAEKQASALLALLSAEKEKEEQRELTMAKKRERKRQRRKAKLDKERAERDITEEETGCDVDKVIEEMISAPAACNGGDKVDPQPRASSSRSPSPVEEPTPVYRVEPPSATTTSTTGHNLAHESPSANARKKKKGKSSPPPSSNPQTQEETPSRRDRQRVKKQTPRKSRGDEAVSQTPPTGGVSSSKEKDEWEADCELEYEAYYQEYTRPEEEWRTVEDQWKTVPKYKTKLTLPVSKRDIGKVIGQSGATVNSIRQQSGAHIDIEGMKTGSESNERVIQIRGQADSVHKAKQMIEALINGRTTSKEILAKATTKRGSSGSNHSSSGVPLCSVGSTTPVRAVGKATLSTASRPFPIKATITTTPSVVTAPPTRKPLATNSNNNSVSSHWRSSSAREEMNFASVAAAGVVTTLPVPTLEPSGVPTPLKQLEMNFPTISESIKLHRRGTERPVQSNPPTTVAAFNTPAPPTTEKSTPPKADCVVSPSKPDPPAPSIPESADTALNVNTSLNFSVVPATSSELSPRPSVATGGNGSTLVASSGSSCGSKSFPLAPGSERSHHQRSVTTPEHSPTIVDAVPSMPSPFTEPERPATSSAEWSSETNSLHEAQLTQVTESISRWEDKDIPAGYANRQEEWFPRVGLNPKAPTFSPTMRPQGLDRHRAQYMHQQHQRYDNNAELLALRVSELNPGASAFQPRSPMPSIDFNRHLIQQQMRAQPRVPVHGYPGQNQFLNPTASGGPMGNYYPGPIQDTGLYDPVSDTPVTSNICGFPMPGSTGQVPTPIGAERRRAAAPALPTAGPPQADMNAYLMAMVLKYFPHASQEHQMAAFSAMQQQLHQNPQWMGVQQPTPQPQQHAYWGQGQWD